MGKKVLVVDDEPDVANLEKVTLTNAGFDVVMAHDGVEALAMVASESPDAMVLDVMMPGMDGWEVARRLRENPETEGLPILMLTALGIPEERVPGFSDVNEYYTKPFVPSVLVKYVRRLAGS